MTVKVRGSKGTTISVTPDLQKEASIVIRRSTDADLFLRNLADVSNTVLQDGYVIVYNSNTNLFQGNSAVDVFNQVAGNPLSNVLSGNGIVITNYEPYLGTRSPLINLKDSGVVSGVYGNTSPTILIPVANVDRYGRIVSIANQGIANAEVRVANLIVTGTILAEGNSVTAATGIFTNNVLTNVFTANNAYLANTSTLVIQGNNAYFTNLSATSVLLNSLSGNTANFTSNVLLGNVLTSRVQATSGTFTDNVTTTVVSANSVYSGNIASNELSSFTVKVGNVQGNTASFTSNVSTGNLLTSRIQATSGNFSENVNTVVVSSNNIFSGNLDSDVISANNVYLTDLQGSTSTFTGNVSTGNISSSRIEAVSGSFSNNVTTNVVSTQSLYTANADTEILNFTTGYGSNVVVETLFVNNASFSSNVVAGNISTGRVEGTSAHFADNVVTGNVSALNLYSLRLDTQNVSTTSLSTNSAYSNALYTNEITSTVGTFYANVNTGNISTNRLEAVSGNFSGNLTSDSIHTGPVYATTGNYSGNVATGNIATNRLEAVSASFTGNATVGNLYAENFVTPNLLAYYGNFAQNLISATFHTNHIFSSNIDSGNVNTNYVYGIGADFVQNVSAGNLNASQTVTTNDLRVLGSLYSNDITADFVVVQGNLFVQGTTTTINTEEIALADNKIVINSNQTGVPVEDAAIVVNRGNQANVEVLWDETYNVWKFTNDGNVYYLIPTTTSDLIEGANLYYTNARVHASLSVNDIGGDGELVYNSANGLFTYRGPSSSEVRAHLSAADLGGDGSFSYDNTTGVFSYTGPSNAEVRAHLSAADLGGDGSFSYDNTTGVFSYTGPSASEVRAHLSAGIGLNYDNTSGQFRLANTSVTAGTYGNSILIPIFTVDDQGRISNVQTTLVAGVSNFTANGNVFTIFTTSGQTFTASIQPNSVALGRDTYGDYVSNLTAGIGVTVLNNTGEGSNVTVRIGQNVDPTATVTFSNVSAHTFNGNIVGNFGNIKNLVGATINLTGDITANSFFTNVIETTVITSNNIFANSITLTDYVSAANATFSSNLGTGNLFVSGNTNIKDLWVYGEAHFYGNVTTYEANNLSISDNMIFLNQGNQNTNPDIGFAFNYNDGIYRHGGFFRDASDGNFKVFDQYEPEPQNSQFIDTANTTFHLANLQATTFIGNLQGDVYGTVSSLANHTTSNVAEGANLYFTNNRVYSNVIALNYITNAALVGYATNAEIALKANITDLNTSNVVEGVNLYFTTARARESISVSGAGLYDNTTGLITIIGGVSSVGGSTGNITNAQLASFIVDSGLLTTSNVSEGANLYFTNVRAVEAVQNTNPIFNDVIVQGSLFSNDITADNVVIQGNLFVQGTTTSIQTNELSIDDNKITLNSNVTGAPILDAGIIVNRGSNANVELQWNESIDRWQFTNDGAVYYLIPTSTSDLQEGANLYFTTQRSRDSISAGVGINYDNTSGVVRLANTTVIANTYGNGISIPVITVDDQGRITNVSTALVAGVSSFTTNANTLTIVTSAGSSFQANLDPDLIVSSTPPTPAYQGLTWIDSNTGKRFEFFGDEDSFQWVELISDGVIPITSNASVQSVNGLVGLVSLTTTNIPEGANLYHSNTRVVTALTGGTGIEISSNGLITANVGVIGGGSVTSVNGLVGAVNLVTANINEVNNLYFTNARVQTYLETVGNIIPSGNNIQTLGSPTKRFKDLYISGNSIYLGSVVLSSSDNGKFRVTSQSTTTNLISDTDLTTANVAEVTNLYFTNTRAISALSEGSGINIDANGLITATVTAGAVNSFNNISVVNGTEGNIVASGSDTLKIQTTGLITANTNPSTKTLSFTIGGNFPFFDSNGSQNNIALRVADSTVQNSVSFIYLPFSKSDGTPVNTLRYQ